jgi:hypothetical protein
LPPEAAFGGFAASGVAAGMIETFSADDPCAIAFGDVLCP